MSLLKSVLRFVDSILQPQQSETDTEETDFDYEDTDEADFEDSDFDYEDTDEADFEDSMISWKCPSCGWQEYTSSSVCSNCYDEIDPSY